jgi:hypothetical protein
MRLLVNKVLGIQTPQFFSSSILLLFTISISLAFVGFLASPTPYIQAQAPSQGETLVGFYANLSGKEEIPPNSINASGLAVFLFVNESSELSYLVNTSGLEKISQSHIYNGSANINGEEVAPLSEEESANGENITSIMFEGDISDNDLTGILDGNKTSDLVSLMSNGSAYVNIHTDEYLDGAIRGQIEMGQVQTNGSAITGLATPGGLVGLSGISLTGGSIIFAPGGGIIGFLPIPISGNSPTGSGNGGSGGANGGVGGVVDEASSVVGELGGVVGTVGGTVDSTANNLDNTVQKIDEEVVQKILDDDEDDDGDSKDSDDDGDSKDSDDDGDSKDSDDDDDEKDDDDDEKDDDDDEKDDDGDSLKDKVGDLLD